MRYLINKSGVMPARATPVAAKRLPLLADYMTAEANNFALVRLLMALAVLVSHSWWLATGRSSEEPLHIWTNHSLGEHAVQVFFFLSGIVVAQSLFKSKSLIDFACARLLRIFPALIVCVLVTAFLLGPAVSTFGLTRYFGDSGLVAYVVKTLSLSTGSAPLPGVFPDHPVPRLVNLSLWTLKYEVLCYALLGMFGMLYLAWPKLRPYLTAALVLVIALIFVGEPKPASSYTALDNVRYFILFFGMGTLAYLFRERLVLSWLALPLLFLAFAFAIGTRYAELTAALFLGYGTLLFATLRLPRLRWFTNDQDYSYAVYILHCPVQQALVQLKPGIDPVELTLVTLAFVIPFSVLSWTYIERPAMNARRALVSWLRALRPTRIAAATSLSEPVPAAAKANLLKQRVKALAVGHGSSVTPLDLGRSTARSMPPLEENSMPRDNGTMSRPEAAPPAIARTGASSVTRSKVAEWFSRQRKVDKDTLTASISDQFAARIQAAARQAGVDLEHLEPGQQRASVSAERLPQSSGAHTDVAGARKTSRTRRLSRMVKPAAAGTRPSVSQAPAMPRSRPSRLSNVAPTKLWARPSRMVMAEPGPVLRNAGIRAANTSKAADLLDVALSTKREMKPEAAKSFAAPAEPVVPRTRLARGAAKSLGAQTGTMDTSQGLIENELPAPAEGSHLRPRVAPDKASALRERLTQLVARRNEAVQKRLAKQRSNPIPLA